MDERELSVTCEECGYEGTIEEKRDYEGELLSVSVCPVCGTHNWMLPKDWDEENDETLELTNNWAKEESIKILKKRNLFYKIEFTKPAKQLIEDLEVMDEIKKKIIEVCKILDTNKALIEKYYRGIKILLDSRG